MEIIRAGEIMASHPEHQRLPHEPAYIAGSAFVADHFCPVTEAVDANRPSSRLEEPQRKR